MFERLESFLARQEAFDTGDLPELNAYRPFPLSTLPQPVRGFIERGSAAVQCDASYLALPMLVAVAAAVGYTRAVRLTEDWIVPSILWGAIVGESGSSKTPAFKLVMESLRSRNQRALQLHQAAMELHAKEMLCYETALKQWKKSSERVAPPEPPERPLATRYIVSDTTIEALAPILQANPRGVLLERDELSGWIGSFDRYSAGNSDAANWLSMHGGDSITVDRKTGEPRTIFISKAYVSLIGGIQPGILRQVLGRSHRESGLAARLLVVCPPRRNKSWQKTQIGSEYKQKITAMFDRLYKLEPMIDHEGTERPRMLDLTDDAETVWETFYNEHAKEQIELTGDLAAAWSKLEETAARLALVIHCMRMATDDPSLQDPNRIDTQSMISATALTDWFKVETRRVYALFDETEEEKRFRRLVQWIERRGGRATVRDIQRGNRWVNSADMARAALSKLVTAGLGTWEEMEENPNKNIFVLSTSTKRG